MKIMESLNHTSRGMKNFDDILLWCRKKWRCSLRYPLHQSSNQPNQFMQSAISRSNMQFSFIIPYNCGTINNEMKHLTIKFIKVIRIAGIYETWNCKKCCPIKRDPALLDLDQSSNQLKLFMPKAQNAIYDYFDVHVYKIHEKTDEPDCMQQFIIRIIEIRRLKNAFYPS